ncbi:hypothetical protein Taro_025684 [Colocasia esculenta]|uniref:Uncharacterized protein n=1 Tax=Colocasia esculenta TaxID=4460 RepID=A0A843VA06_COLES|nr:hypothetical protein [Colocasia esculenta]
MRQGHPRMSKKWVASIVKSKLIDIPIYIVCDMKQDIQREHGILIPYHQVILAFEKVKSLKFVPKRYLKQQAWLGKELAMNTLYGDIRTSYDMLLWYNQRVTYTNSGTIVDLQIEVETQRFMWRIASVKPVKPITHLIRVRLPRTGRSLARDTKPQSV